MKLIRGSLLCVLICVLLPVFICKEYLVSIFSYDNPLLFSVYYDAGNAAPSAWFTQDFKVNYKTFQDYLNFGLSPCLGVTISSDGKTITCADPHKDCYLNKLHACAVQHIKFGPKLNDFVSCTFECTQDPLTKCTGGDQSLTKVLGDCAKGSEGVKLCINSASNPPPFKKPLLFGADVFFQPPFNVIDAICKMLKLHAAKMPTLCNK